MSKLHLLLEMIDEEFPETDVPTAMDIWRKSQSYYAAEDTVKSERLVKANYLLHNCFLPASARVGRDTKLAYGGMGVIVHKDARIGRRCTLGSGVTIAGTCKSIGDDVYISGGAKILDGTVGGASIIGANAVILSDIPPLSIYGGVPAKRIGNITLENCKKYRGYFFYKNSEDMLKQFVDMYLT